MIKMRLSVTKRNQPFGRNSVKFDEFQIILYGMNRYARSIKIDSHLCEEEKKKFFLHPND